MVLLCANLVSKRRWCMCLVVSRVVSAKKGPSVAQKTVERYKTCSWLSINLAIWSASSCCCRQAGQHLAASSLLAVWSTGACANRALGSALRFGLSLDHRQVEHGHGQHAADRFMGHTSTECPAPACLLPCFVKEKRACARSRCMPLLFDIAGGEC